MASRLNGHGLGWTLGVGDGQGGLACCGSWGCKESDTTEWLNWTVWVFHYRNTFHGRKAMTNLQCVKKQRHHFADKGPYSQGYGLSSSHVQMWELGSKEGRVPKNWCFQTVVLKKTLESPLESKEIKTVNLKGNQSRILFRKTDAEAEAPILWLPDSNHWLIRKDPDAGKDWRQKEKRAKGWDGWMADSMITDSMDMNLGKP